MSSTVELEDDGALRRRQGGPDPMIGRRLLHYRVLEVVGQGGMSVVYRGRDENLDRDVAIKVLHPFLAQKEECRARLAREARAVARLEHPNILKVFDYSGEPHTLNEKLRLGEQTDDDKEGFLVCELVPGDTLKHFADRHSLWDVPEVGGLIVARIARALEHAHEQGVVHRDLKPENVMVRDDGVLKLMDFGIAQVVDQRQLTVTGTLLGSPAHMAPETIEGYPADARSDIFSLGTVLYWLATGCLPFEALTPHALLKAIVDGSARPSQQRSPRVSDEIAKVIAKAMARRPEDRYACAGEMAEALEGAAREAGLEPTDQALAELLLDPDSGKERAGAAVRVAFLARAERLLEEGAAARSLSTLSRVLAQHPGDVAAASLLERAQQGVLDEAPEPAEPEEVTDPGPPRAAPPRPLLAGRAMLALSLLVAVGGVVLVGVLVDDAVPPSARPLQGQSVEEARAGETPALPATPEGTAETEEPPKTPAEKEAAPPREAAPLRVAPRPVIARRAHPDIERKRAAAPLARTVRVFAHPYAHIFVDGEEVARNAIGKELQLAPGMHTLRFEHEHAKTKRVEVDVPAEGTIPDVRVSLDEAKPAYLRVEAVPPDADVAVDGIPKGRASQSADTPIVIPFRKMAARGRFEVMVWKAGYKTELKTPELEAGKTAVVKVVLQPDRDEAGDGRRRPIELDEP